MQKSDYCFRLAKTVAVIGLPAGLLLTIAVSGVFLLVAILGIAVFVIAGAVYYIWDQ